MGHICFFSVTIGVFMRFMLKLTSLCVEKKSRGGYDGPSLSIPNTIIQEILLRKPVTKLGNNLQGVSEEN